MRFLFCFLLAFLLLGVNVRAYACEHSANTTEITLVADSHSSSISYSKDSSHKSQRVGLKIMQLNYCCTGVGMICCLSVSNTLNLTESIYLLSEEILLQSDNYKSYVAYTLQRPPCTTVA